MIGSIIGAIIIGAIIGALARLIMPGKQNIGVIMTVLLGIVGGLAGSAITSAFGYSNEKGIAWVPFIVGIVVAIILIGAYVAITGRRGTTRAPR
jgi:uncharacterized membrane protein YeaQ/YmgE (transglycosylase-associated protein family)